QNRYAGTRALADFLPHRVEERRNFEPLGSKPRIVRKRQPEVASAHYRQTDAAIEAENLLQMPPQLLDVVPDSPHAELTEVGQVLANLRGVEMELLRQGLRRYRPHSGGIERVQTAQVHR